MLIKYANNISVNEAGILIILLRMPSNGILLILVASVSMLKKGRDLI